MKFSHKIVGTSSVLLMLTVGFLGARQTISMQSNMELTVNEAVVEAVNGVRNTVEQELAGKSLLAEFITARAETDLRREHLESLVRESSLSDAFIFVGGALNEDGLAFSSDSSWAPSVKEWDGRTRPWYKQAMQENELIITEPYTDSLTGDIVISIATPLHANSNFNGAMFFDVGLKGLSDLVNRVDLFNAGQLFIVTGSGKVIAHPEKEFNGKPIRDIVPAISIKDKATHQITGVDGIDYQVQFSKVTGQDWFVVSMLDKKVAFASVQSMINSTIVSGLVLLLISVLVLFFAISKLIRPLSSLNEAIGDIASGSGDLTQRLDEKTDYEFSELAKSFNTFASKLQGQIIDLKGMSAEIGQGTERAVINSQGVSNVMTEQFKELEQLATAMHQMSSTSGEVAASAQEAARAAQEADDAAQLGTEVVSQTSASIGGLSERIDSAVIEVGELEHATTSIDTVLRVINDIAEQTNLLALNAAIEAARAGEHGRGFAVVADEVRNLAQRTQTSTTEIQSIVEKLLGSTAAVTEAMQQSKASASTTVEQANLADQALGRILDAIRRISDMNLQIASAAEEQSLVSEEINTNTVKIKGLAVTVSEDSNRTSEDMKTQAGNVVRQQEELDKFAV